MKKEAGSVLPVVVIAVVTVGLVIAGYVVLTKPAPTALPSGQGGQLASTSLKGDVNRDGAVNEEDAEIIRRASPCNHVDPCWKKVVGKTKDGDNPIYTSDLDLNHDDNVNELDISAMTAE